MGPCALMHPHCAPDPYSDVRCPAPCASPRCLVGVPLHVQWFPQTPHAVPGCTPVPVQMQGSGGRFGTTASHSLLDTRLAQGVKENWSCSVGFSTQAPSPALMKAVNRRALAVWYSFAASLDSWYVVGLVILVRSRWGGTCGRTHYTSKARTGAGTEEKESGCNVQKRCSGMKEQTEGSLLGGIVPAGGQA